MNFSDLPADKYGRFGCWSDHDARAIHQTLLHWIPIRSTVTIALGVLITVHQITQDLPSKWIPFGIVMLLGIVFGLLSLKFQKGCTIFATSMIGGALMISCIDYFIEHLSLLSYIWERVRDVPSASLCWYSWVIMGCWDFCIIVGSITQWKITGRGYDHREGESSVWLLGMLGRGWINVA